MSSVYHYQPWRGLDNVPEAVFEEAFVFDGKSGLARCAVYRNRSKIIRVSPPEFFFKIFFSSPFVTVKSKPGVKYGVSFCLGRIPKRTAKIVFPESPKKTKFLIF